MTVLLNNSQKTGNTKYVEVISKRPLVVATIMTDEKDKVQFSEGRRRHEQTEDNSKDC